MYKTNNLGLPNECRSFGAHDRLTRLQGTAWIEVEKNQ
jgi:hypothetical protein